MSNSDSDIATSRWLVISDLDGTLLNHYDYQWHAALPAIRDLIGLHIPIIFNTSKTYLETRQMLRMLGIESPFVVENGSALFLPREQFPQQPDLPGVDISERDAYWQIVLGRSLAQIESILQGLSFDQDKLVKLSCCEPDEVALLTGLTELQAKDAIEREFSEAVLWQGEESDWQQLHAQLLDHDLNTLQGGRFIHILGQTSKARAVQALTALYDGQVKTVALGDSANDLDMLQQADLPIVVSSPGNKHLLERWTPPYITTQPAPDGWNEGIEHALKIIKPEE